MNRYKGLALLALATTTALFLSCATPGNRHTDPRWEGKERSRDLKAPKGRPLPALSALEQERQRVMLNILKQPPIPLKTPDKVLRILLLPYVDENDVLHNYTYTFLKVEEGKWVLGDYLMEPAKAGRRILRPMEGASKEPVARPESH
jgi:hypothetical protein